MRGGPVWGRWVNMDMRGKRVSLGSAMFANIMAAKHKRVLHSKPGNLG